MTSKLNTGPDGRRAAPCPASPLAADEEAPGQAAPTIGTDGRGSPQPGPPASGEADHQDQETGADGARGVRLVAELTPIEEAAQGEPPAASPNGRGKRPWPQVDLVALIKRSGCQLREKGDGKLVGDHTIKHASKSGTCLVVWPSEGRWHCSSCQEGGDAADWLISVEGITREEAARRLRPVAQSQEEPRWAKGLEGSGYLALRNVLYLVVRRGQGLPDLVPLAHFVAGIEEEILHDEGDGSPRRSFKMAGRAEDGTVLPSVSVPAEDFANMGWLLSRWGSRANICAGAGTKDRVREAMQLSGREAPQRTVYAHLGWRQVDGHWVYLHAGGAVGGSGLGVELPSDLDCYRLPAQPEELPQALRASLEMLGVGPLRVTLPLWAAMYLAPLSSILQLDLSVFLEGPSGVLKSTLAALCLSHYGEFSCSSPPASWQSTANSLERLAFLAKDAALWIDDFHPSSDPRTARAMEGVMDRLIRAQGDRTGRGRMRADGSLRPTCPPRGLIVTTGELLPRVASTLARLFSVHVRAGALDLAKLTAAQAQAGRYPHAMAGYLAWLASRLDKLRVSLPRQREELRGRALGECRKLGLHLRQPAQVANLATGLTVWLAFAVEAGALSEEEAAQRQEDWWRALLGAAVEHGGDIAEERPTQKFVAILRDLLASGRVHLRRRDTDGPPFNEEEAGLFGWEVAEVANENGERTTVFRQRPHSLHIGWYSEDRILLILGSAYAEVTKHCRATEEAFPVNQRALLRELLDEGYIAKHSAGRCTCQERIGASPKRVLVLQRSKVLDG